MANTQVVREHRNTSDRMVHVYDALRNTWIYQDLSNLIREELEQELIEEHRAILLKIIQSRFPRIQAQAELIMQTDASRSIWQSLIVEVSIARTAKAARAVLTALE